MKKARLPRDPNARAVMVAKLATGEAEPVPGSRKPAPRRRAGGLKGGKKRAENLTPDQRSEIARVAAEARWKKRT